ncbi:MAG: HIRAN domain-containing protein [Bacteroidales bacterium]|nr:HIRAN domain-containing protein [Bacteroidales bacterium]
MNRATFLKNVIGAFGLAVLPPLSYRHYRKLYLLQCFVRGFQYYAGPGLLDVMKEGSLLELVREPENEFDACAIALHFNNEKIGYIPAEFNEVLSRLLDAGVVEMIAEITHLNPDASTWENVHIAVSVLKETSEPLPENAAYLTWLTTPEYHSVQLAENYIGRVKTNGRNILSGEDFYRELVENSETDEVYDLIHESFGNPEALEEVVDNSLLIVNRNKLPADLIMDELIEAIEEGVIELENIFDEKGYIVAQVDRLAELSSRIERFESVLDKSGSRFFEVVFKS